MIHKTFKCRYCGKDIVKHIVKNGARYHVLSWSLVSDEKGKHAETDCSTENCEYNHMNGKCLKRENNRKVEFTSFRE